MNGLSWFLYFVDISLNFKVVAWMAVGAVAVAMVFVPKKGVEAFSFEHDSPFQGVTRPFLWILGAFFILLAISIPSQETLYMIAASEIGEQIIKIEEVQALGGEVGGLASDTIALLREKIQSQLTTE